MGTALLERFRVEIDTFGADNEITTFSNPQGCRFGQRTLGYLTGQYSANRPDRLRGLGDVERIFTCQLGHLRAVYNDAGCFRTYAQSVSYVGINNQGNFNRLDHLRAVLNTLAGYQGTLTGRVLDNLTGAPIEGAQVDVGNCRMGVTDAEGRFSVPRIPNALTIARVTRRGWTTLEDVEVNFNGRPTLNLELRLHRPTMVITPDRLLVTVPQNGSVSRRVTVSNEGDGPLEVAARIKGMQLDYPLNGIIQSFDARTATRDSSLQAAMFFNGCYWVAGAGNFRPNKFLYQIDAEGNLIATYSQNSQQELGWTDLTCDDEFIYAIDGNRIVQINPHTGEPTGVRITVNVNPGQGLTWDSERDIFWVAGMGTNIAGVDRQGVQRFTVLNRQRFRIYGLAFDRYDPDGYQLYILNAAELHPAQVIKAQVQSGDARVVTNLDIAGSLQGGGGEITEDLYPFTTTLVSQFQGGAQPLNTVEMRSSLTWARIGPAVLQVPAGQSADFVVSAAGDGFNIGAVVDAYVQLDHNTPEGSRWLEVQMLVTPPASVPDDALLPSEIRLSAVYPNPFNSAAKIDFYLNRSGSVRLALFDLSGRMVGDVLSGEYSAGAHTFTVDGADIPAGVYLMRLSAGKVTDSRKVALVK